MEKVKIKLKKILISLWTLLYSYFIDVGFAMEAHEKTDGTKSIEDTHNGFIESDEISNDRISHRQDKLLFSMDETCEKLGMSRKTLLVHIRQGDIKYIRIGQQTRKFTQSDLEEFIETRREVECPYTSPRGRHSTNMISGSTVIGITELHEKRQKEKLNTSRH